MHDFKLIVKLMSRKHFGLLLKIILISASFQNKKFDEKHQIFNNLSLSFYNSKVYNVMFDLLRTK